MNFISIDLAAHSYNTVGLTINSQKVLKSMQQYQRSFSNLTEYIRFQKPATKDFPSMCKMCKN